MIYQKRNLEFEVLEQRQQLMKIKSYTKKIVGDVPKEYPQQIFNQLLAFQGYGFNECLDIHSLVELKDGSKIELKDVKVGDEIKSANNKFRHKYKNKLEYVADDKNIDYNKIIGLPINPASFAALNCFCFLAQSPRPTSAQLLLSSISRISLKDLRDLTFVPVNKLVHELSKELLKKKSPTAFLQDLAVTQVASSQLCGSISPSVYPQTVQSPPSSQDLLRLCTSFCSAAPQRMHVKVCAAAV